MVNVENIITDEILKINRGTIRERKSLKALLSDNRIGNIEYDIRILDYIRENVSIPSDKILLPITIYLVPGSAEGYLLDELDARVIEDLGYKIRKRENKYYIARRDIDKILRRFPYCFQILYTL